MVFLISLSLQDKILIRTKQLFSLNILQCDGLSTGMLDQYVKDTHRVPRKLVALESYQKIFRRRLAYNFTLTMRIGLTKNDWMKCTSQNFPIAKRALYLKIIKYTTGFEPDSTQNFPDFKIFYLYRFLHVRELLLVNLSKIT